MPGDGMEPYGGGDLYPLPPPGEGQPGTAPGRNEVLGIDDILILLGVAIVGGIVANVASNEIDRALHDKPTPTPSTPTPPPPPPPPTNPQDGIIITPL